MRPLPPLPDWLVLEHQVAQILTEQENHGWHFNECAARELESALRREYEETSQLLRNRHPFVKGAVFTPKRNNRTKGYVAEAPFTKPTLTPSVSPEDKSKQSPMPSSTGLGIAK